MIMTAHVVFAALDPDRPATLSHAVVTGLLRERLGYTGVIVSDDLDMKAIAATMGADTAAVGAIRAGCDARCCAAIARTSCSPRRVCSRPPSATPSYAGGLPRAPQESAR